MKSKTRIGMAACLALALLNHVNAGQGTPPNQARADADLNRQKAEAQAVQKRNEQTDKEERAQFEARKKGYEQEERRKEDKERSLRQAGQGKR